MLAISMLLVAGASAPIAAAGELSYEGATTVVFSAGDDLDHELQVRSNSGADEFIDSQQFTTIPGDCTVVVANTWISCPGRVQVKADFGAGNDSFTTEHSTNWDCFDVYTINLGEGSNDSNFSTACGTPATATINAGGGEDTLYGGSATTTTTMFAGGGADTLNGREAAEVIHAGEGADRVFGNGGNDQLFGEGGNDILMGAAGNDIEDGGTGDDIIGGPLGLSSPRDNDQGADTLRGGDGTDQLVLESHVGAMTITLDGQPNDGAPSEGDNIASDFEQIDGTGGSDVFHGSAAADKFLGGSGNDEIHGGGGDDNLAGDGGDDRVYGEAGNDKVEGTNGADTVDGGSGTDQIYGDIASCSVFCNFDPDKIFARDGEADTVDCGGGADTAQVDQLDVVAFCTVVDRATVAVPGGPAVPGGGVPDPFALKVAGSARSKALLKKGLTVRLKCPAACKIAAELRYKSKKLGSARKTLKKAASARLVVKISKKARRTIRRLKKGNLTLRVKVTVAGKTTTLTRTVKFRR